MNFDLMLVLVCISQQLSQKTGLQSSSTLPSSSSDRKSSLSLSAVTFDERVHNFQMSECLNLLLEKLDPGILRPIISEIWNHEIGPINLCILEKHKKSTVN
jgi:hypothetical protein